MDRRARAASMPALGMKEPKVAEAQLRSADLYAELLGTARADSAEFPPFMANHAPMMLYALKRLGASEARIAEFYDTYRVASGLVEAPPRVAPVERAVWRDALGDRTRESDYRAFFEGEVLRLGVRDTLAAYLPDLIPGIGASALHPLMRLAYGLMQDNPAEIGTALGYWAASYLPLPPAGVARPRTRDPGAVLLGVAAIEGLPAEPPEIDLLWHHARAVAWSPAFAGVIDWLEIDGATRRRMAAAALALFAGTGDFSALHALTGLHWARIVAPFCPDEAVLLRHFWGFIAALVPKIGARALPDEATLGAARAQPCPDWPVIAAAAVASDDEHDISLAFSAREEEALTGDRLYRVVAARRLGLIG